MKAVTKEVEVFVASDGKEFIDQKECLNYEENTLKRLSKIKHFLVHHGADFTEGKGFFSTSLIAVESDYYHEEWAEMYCQLKLGQKVSWMYHTPAKCWGFTPITKEVYNSTTPKYGEKVFISHSNMPGYPLALKITSDTKKL